MSFFGSVQKVGKALMLPIAVMPAAALLLRFGQDDLLNIKWMAEAGNAIFSNLPLLFAIGVAVGLAGESGVAGLAGMVGYFVFTKVLVTINKDLDMGVLAGILSGVLAAQMYKYGKDVKIPEFLGFFRGKRFVPIITSVSAMILGAIFGYVWAPVQAVITALGTWIVNAGAVGTFVFYTLNRLLIPTGLHHIINTMVWFTFGDFKGGDGKVVHGDLWRFFAKDPSAGGFMAGFFPIMMFGLLGAALAMYQEARPAQRKIVGGIMFSAALTAFLTGITEPLEFAFMFIAPVLYVIHALLTGVAGALMSVLGVKLGFGFSAGLIDYVINYGISTQPLMLIPIGAAFFAVYYGIFRFAIRKWNLATPGRDAEDDPVLDAGAASAD